jgi:hypothetical protein
MEICTKNRYSSRDPDGDAGRFLIFATTTAWWHVGSRIRFGALPNARKPDRWTETNENRSTPKGDDDGGATTRNGPLQSIPGTWY